MSNSKIYLDWDEPFTQGDRLELHCTLNENLTGANIRVEITDKFGHCVQKASENVTGGSSSQINITDASNGEFTIYTDNGDTECLDKTSFIEIEREDSSGNKKTVLQKKIKFTEESVDW